MLAGQQKLDLQPSLRLVLDAYLQHLERMRTIQTCNSKKTHYTYDVYDRLAPRSTPGHLLHIG
jgi:hypothetical protein